MQYSAGGMVGKRQLIMISPMTTMTSGQYLVSMSSSGIKRSLYKLN